MKRFTLTLLTALALAPVLSHAQLVAGDVIFTGYDARGTATTDWFSFVLTKIIPSGTTINFTDIGYIGTGAASNANTFTSTSATLEGAISWTSGSQLAAGTEITISGSAAYLNGSTTTTNGTVSAIGGSGTMSLQAADQVIAYTGALSPSATFLAGMHWNTCSGNTTSAGWDPLTCTNASSSSQLPPGLTNSGATASAIYIGVPSGGGNYDRGVFNCNTVISPSPANFRAAAVNASNWDRIDASGAVTPPTGSACGPTYYGAALPVTLMSFNASRTDGVVAVEWTVGRESSIREYQVARSENGQDFEALGTVTAEGNNRTYRFTDRTTRSASYYFYRLKALAFDGTAQYSNTVRVAAADALATDIRLLRNPAGPSLELEVVAAGDGVAHIVVTDLIGRVILQREWPVHAGSQKVSCPSAGMAPAQIYLLTGYTDGKVWKARVLR